jgi:Leucine-rich repeat (LRR) protein
MCRIKGASLDGYLSELNFSTLPFLTHIDLSYNSLRGEIPLSITTLPELSYLDLGFNRLHGNIPSECIPASFGNLTGYPIGKP